MIINMPCYSIFHLSQKTRLKLYDDAFDRSKVAMDDEEENIFLTRPHKYDDTYPPDLRQVLDTLAPASEFGWIMLSIDGDNHPDLPLY